jgi:hypothetical protein
MTSQIQATENVQLADNKVLFQVLVQQGIQETDSFIATTILQTLARFEVMKPRYSLLMSNISLIMSPSFP